MNQQQPSELLKFFSEIKLNGVIMIDGLKRNDVRERQTGIRIFSELEDINSLQSDKKISCSRHKVATAEDLRVRMRAIADEIPENFAFILHLECHGDENGIELGDCRDRMEWKDFLDLLVPINIKNKCNVGLILACCDGYGSFKVEDLAKEVPFYFQLANKGEIKAGKLESCLISFYREILINHDIVAAIKAAEPFKIKYAEEIFVRLMYILFHTKPRGKLTQLHVNTVLSGVLAKGGINKNMNVAYNRNIVKNHSGTFEQQISNCIQDNLSFFCERKPAFELHKLVEWISGGKT